MYTLYTLCKIFSRIIGNFDLGVLGRGLYTEIGTYVEVFFNHELSANIIDLCPVGALLPMVNAFTARS
jgi:NADH-quinone oxidoreductase subunit G